MDRYGIIHAHGLDVVIGEDQHLHVLGSDLVIENPFLGSGVEVDLGLLWASIWAEDLHNRPNPHRLRALLLNAAQVSVNRIMTILTKEGEK